MHVLDDVVGVQAVPLLDSICFHVEVRHQMIDSLQGEETVALLLVVFVEQHRALPGEVLEHCGEGLCHLHVRRSDAGQLGVFTVLVAEAGGQGTCRDHRDVPVGRQPHHRGRLVLAHWSQNQIRLLPTRPVQQPKQSIIDTIGVLKLDVEAEPGVIRLQPQLRVTNRRCNSCI